MNHVKIYAAALSLAVLTTYCGEEESPTPQLGAWAFYAPPFEGVWNHCDVQRDGTFWGTVQLGGSSRAAIARFDGASWSKQEFEPSITEALNAILMFDDGSGWACGSSGALLQRRDGEWKLHRPFDNIDFYYLAASTPSSVWAIGQATVYPRGYEPVIFQYDGERWRENLKLFGYTSLGPVEVTADGGYLVGRRDEGDVILRLSSRLFWGNPVTFERPLRFYDLAAGGGYAFAVGEERPSSAKRGAVYQVAPSVRDITPRFTWAPDYYYRAAYATSYGGLWVSAAPYGSANRDHKLLYWDGSAWYEAGVANQTGTAARVLEFGFASGEGWAVGGDTYARYRKP